MARRIRSAAWRRSWRRRARWASWSAAAGGPERTIVYTSWDGEEPGLLGSTEWVEHHADELRQKAVVYINSDGNGRGALERRRVAPAGSLHQQRRARHRRSGCRCQRVETLAVDGHRDRDGGETARGADARRPPHRRAWIGIGLLAVPPASRYGDAEPRLRRPRRRRHLPFDLRRLLSLHEVPRHRLPLRPRARADGRDGGHPAGGCRPAAVRVHESRRHRPGLRQGRAAAPEDVAGSGRRTQSPD